MNCLFIVLIVIKKWFICHLGFYNSVVLDHGFDETKIVK